MIDKVWSWDRLFRVGNRVERRTEHWSRIRERVRARLEKHPRTRRRISYLRARIRRISRRIERVEMRREEVLWALKGKWLSEWDRLID